MKNIITAAILCFYSIHNFAQTDKDLVVKSFEKYKKAILLNKGEEASKLVNKETFKYYGTLLNRIKTADSLEINSMKLIDKLTLLSIKHTAKKEDLNGLNGEKLFIYAINSGMIGKDNIVNFSLGNVSTEGNFSKAEFIINEQKTPFFFHFHKENNIWKIDMNHLLYLATLPLNSMVQNSGANENKFIINIIEMLTGRKTKNNIWQPL